MADDKSSLDTRPTLFNDFALKRAFLAEYGGFADRRIKKIENGRRFIVDSRGKPDIASNGIPYSYFCAIFVEVITDDLIEVSLSGNVPKGPAVAEWINRHNPSSTDPFLEFNVTRGKQQMLEGLASAIRAIVKPGAPRYAVAGYKYACPATAFSLDRLKGVLDRAWK